ncbi:BppU family phage baseplate upper protein [Bacillus toyonensis]|uniref:BppU family phage baseplate upper protein n=1 Tax=Bacillus toyonensis TaxID=155322 RepID=UPI002714C6AA|nr:BppU family phage baseplate upper protein [Bacillus toyonensis]
MKIKLVLDINKNLQAQLNAVVTGRQGDKVSNTVNVFVVDGGIPYNLTGNTIFYEGLKPNDAYVRDSSGVKMINATQGNFEYTFRPETFGVAGIGKRSYFTIEQGGTVRASTQDFGLVTLADAMTGNTMSGPYISELEELINLAQWLVDDINSRWTDINTQLTQLQNKLSGMDVVKRSGDSMTGTLTTKTLINEVDMIIRNGTGGRRSRMFLDNSNNEAAWTVVTEKTAGVGDWDWNGHLRVGDRRNWLKNSGDIMTGALTMQNDILFDGPRQIASKTSTGQLVFGNSGVWLGDANGGGIPWQYRYSDKMFIINSRAQLGTVDVMAHVNMSSNSQINYNQLTNTTSAKGFMFMDDGGATAVGGIGRFRNPTGEAYYMGWGSSPWSAATSLTVSNSVFTYKNFAITTAEKDGTETPTISNATLPDSNYLLQAIRRGNTVMLKGAITVNANATALTVATLSANYRPAGGYNVRTYVTPNAGGTPAELFINGSTGAIAFNDKAKGNRIDFCITYTVN